MEPDYTALAGPAYFALIGVELWISRRRRLGHYRVDDAINDISTGLLMQLTLLLSRGIVVAGFLAIHEHLRIADLSAGEPAVWLTCFVGVDLAYYWFHRLSHEVNFLWAAHVVHHQSEDYNLAVALRQSTLQPFLGCVFYWPLAFLGFPPAVYLACFSIKTIYQFWLHTQMIGSLGPLEAVLVTPSHHRVHHGRNPIYIDRNHGGTFIVWDRLFGTFQRETEPVIYGITTPLESWNPIWANLHYWVELARTAHRTRNPLDKLRTFLKPPGWYPQDQGGVRPPPPIEEPISKYGLAHPPELAGYALFQLGLLVLATVALVFFEGRYGIETRVISAGLVVWGLMNLGGLFDRRRWALGSELVRASVMPLAPFALLGETTAWSVAPILGTGFVWLAIRWNRFTRFSGGTIRSSRRRRIVESRR